PAASRVPFYIGFAVGASTQDIQQISDKYNLQLTALGTTGLELATVDADQAPALKQLLSNLPQVGCVADSQATCEATLAAAATTSPPPAVTSAPPPTAAVEPVVVGDSLPEAARLTGAVTFSVAIQSAAGPVLVTFTVSGPLGATVPMSVPAQPSASDSHQYAASESWDSSAVADGTYTLSVTATDANGKAATLQRVYQVQNAAPTSPTQFAAAPSSAGVALSWQQPAVAQARAYRLFRDDADLTRLFGGLSADERSFVDGLAPGGVHHYKLTLVDTFGRESRPATADASVPSDSRPASPAPTVGLTLITPSGDPLVRGGLVSDRVELRAQALPAASALTFEFSSDNQSWQHVPASITCTDVCRALWSLGGLTPGHYLVRARAVDSGVMSPLSSFVLAPSSSPAPPTPPSSHSVSAVPPAPTTIQMTVDGSSARLDWAPSADPSVTYDVYRIDPGGSGLVLAASNVAQASFTDS